MIAALWEMQGLEWISYWRIFVHRVLSLLLLFRICQFCARLTTTGGSGFACYLITLTCGQLAAEKIDLSILDEITHHLVICKGDDLHAMELCVSHDGIKRGQVFYHWELHIWIIGPAWTGSTTFPREVFESSLNPNNIRSGSLGQMVGIPSVCMLISATGWLSCPDRLKFIAYQSHLSPMSG